MKKGCFFTSIFVLTFTIGVGFYIFKKYGPNLKEYGKEKLFELTKESVTDKINELESNDFQDSLKIMMTNFMDKFDKEDFDLAMDETSDFFDKINTYIEDNKIDSLEFDILKKIAMKNERHKKN